MKKTVKTKSVIRKTASRQQKAKSVKLVRVSHPLLRHLKLIEHRHTGSVIHVRHTSHAALFVMLVFVGFFLFISQNLANASHLTNSGSVTVGLVVTGPAPPIGATITSPVDQASIVNINPTEVTGTCYANSSVIVYNDGTLSSSTICDTNGTFATSVQLHNGQNILTARNFDNLNQPGPDTPAVTVTFTTPNPLPEVVAPILPDNPVIIPGAATGPLDCDGYVPSGELKTGGQPHIAVVCVPRSIETGQDHAIGIIAWGGTPPYAINFKWGSGDTTLVSMEAPGYRTVKMRYASSGIYNISVQLTDNSAHEATGESAVEVTSATEQTLTQLLNSITNTSWFETPVPLYVTAVALTLGFWGGDVFQRNFSVTRRHRRPKKV